MRRLRARVAGVLLPAAVALLAAGCGGGDGGGGGDRTDAGSEARERTPSMSPSPPPPVPSDAPGSSPGATGNAEDSTRGGAEDSARDSAGDGSEGPKVPAAELTPATGTFSEKQKKYLIERVPEGTDPAAVLEAGQAACARIGTTADADREAAVSALEAGEIANAEAAIRHLCPQYGPLLEEAGRR